MDGALVVDKPEGPTSHDVVAVARRALQITSIGHTGTLDPMATGVLVLLLGRATRLAQFLASHRKTYDAVVRLGVVSDTWDRTGADMPAPGGTLPDIGAVERVLGGFVGLRPQLPPPFSAKKVAGVRAHVLARRGRPVDISPCVVQLHDARVTGVEWPLVRLTIETSAGFYVRSLAHELGQALGCGARLEALRRTASGDFGVADAVGLDQVERDAAGVASRILPMSRMLSDLPAVVLDEAAADRAAHGNEVQVPDGAEEAVAAGGGPVRLLAPDGSLLAMARPGGRRGTLHPAVVLK